MTRSSEDETTTLPWARPPLSEWFIIGMNHYYVEGVKHLFVAMGRGKQFIKAEGIDEAQVFTELSGKALASEQTGSAKS